MEYIFKALSEESRLRILSLIFEEEMCVCEIETCLKMTQSNASRHLTVLKLSGILDCSKKAQWAYYKISDVFKLEQRELYEYLLRKVKELPTYETDQMEFAKIKGIEICEHLSNPH